MTLSIRAGCPRDLKAWLEKEVSASEETKGRVMTAVGVGAFTRHIGDDFGAVGARVERQQSATTKGRSVNSQPKFSCIAAT